MHSNYPRKINVDKTTAAIPSARFKVKPDAELVLLVVAAVGEVAVTWGGELELVLFTYCFRRRTISGEGWFGFG